MRVELAYPYTDEKGVDHRPDTTLSLPDDVAQQLIADGRARPASDKTTKKE